jgi:hypothetical protein
MATISSTVGLATEGFISGLHNPWRVPSRISSSWRMR